MVGMQTFNSTLQMRMLRFKDKQECTGLSLLKPDLCTVLDPPCTPTPTPLWCNTLTF